jgi:hypothetical protein
MTRRGLDAQVRRPGEPPLSDFDYVEPGVFWWAFHPDSAERRGAPEGREPRFAATNTPVGRNDAQANAGVVVLVDDVDKASAELAEALLRVWTARSFFVEEVDLFIRQSSSSDDGHLLILTTGGLRDLPIAVKRRCVVLTLQVPSADQLMNIAFAHGLADDPGLAASVADQLLWASREQGWPLSVSDFLDALKITQELRIEPGTPEWKMAALPQLAFEDALKDRPSYQAPIGDLAASSRQCRVFLCHSSGDKPAVRELYRQLREEGFDPWLDEKNILPGKDWEDEIVTAVQSADLVIVCLSKGSVAKTGFIQREIRMVLDLAEEQPEGKIFLIPARLEECDVPRRLARRQWVDLFDRDGYNRLLSAMWTAAESLDLAPTAGELAARRDMPISQSDSSQ